MSKIIITPLGTVSPYTKGNMNCPGFLVEYNNQKILLDCGNGITRLLNLPEDLKDLRIIVTHYHKDHFEDLDALQYASYVYHNLGLLDRKIKIYLPENDMKVPKIQMVVLTHCGWSTVAGARNEPNQQTKVYLKKVYDILSKHRTLLSTDNPDNHLFMLDDFLGSGRISSIESKPMELLQEGETKVIDRVRVSVNKSVDKCKNQLKFISNQLW